LGGFRNKHSGGLGLAGWGVGLGFVASGSGRKVQKHAIGTWMKVCGKAREFKGSLLGRKTLSQFPDVFLTSLLFCAVHFSFE